MMNTSSFQLTVSELFHPAIHGIDANSDPKILHHFIVIYTYSFLDLLDEDEDTYSSSSENDDEENNQIDGVVGSIFDIECDNSTEPYIKQLLDVIHDDILHKCHIIPKKHPIISNYYNIAKKGLQIDISQNIILSGGEKVAIIKTMWIRIIQRTWKRVYRAYLWARYLRVLRGAARLEVAERRPRLLRGLLHDILRR